MNKLIALGLVAVGLYWWLRPAPSGKVSIVNRAANALNEILDADLYSGLSPSSVPLINLETNKTPLPEVYKHKTKYGTIEIHDDLAPILPTEANRIYGSPYLDQPGARIGEAIVNSISSWFN